MVNSEFDELKFKIKDKGDLPERNANLQLVHGRLKLHNREIELKLRDKKKEGERLIMVLAELNLKLKKYEKEESDNKTPATTEEK